MYYEIYIFVIFFFILPLVSFSCIRFLYKTWWSRHRFCFFRKKISGGDVVGPAIPGLRAVLDLVPIHPILPPTVHIHL